MKPGKLDRPRRTHHPAAERTDGQRMSQARGPPVAPLTRPAAWRRSPSAGGRDHLGLLADAEHCPPRPTWPPSWGVHGDVREALGRAAPARPGGDPASRWWQLRRTRRLPDGALAGAAARGVLADLRDVGDQYTAVAGAAASSPPSAAPPTIWPASTGRRGQSRRHRPAPSRASGTSTWRCAAAQSPADPPGAAAAG